MDEKVIIVNEKITLKTNIHSPVHVKHKRKKNGNHFKFTDILIRHGYFSLNAFLLYIMDINL